MNRLLKLITFSALFLHLLGVFPDLKIFNNIYTVRENLAFAQEEEQKKDEQPEKKAEDAQETKDEKLDRLLKNIKVQGNRNNKRP